MRQASLLISFRGVLLFMWWSVWCLVLWEVAPGGGLAAIILFVCLFVFLLWKAGRQAGRQRTDGEKFSLCCSRPKMPSPETSPGWRSSPELHLSLPCGLTSLQAHGPPSVAFLGVGLELVGSKAARTGFALWWLDLQAVATPWPPG